MLEWRRSLHTQQANKFVILLDSEFQPMVKVVSGILLLVLLNLQGMCKIHLDNHLKAHRNKFVILDRNLNKVINIINNIIISMKMTLGQQQDRKLYANKKLDDFSKVSRIYHR